MKKTLVRQLNSQDGFIERETTEIYLFIDIRDHFGITQCVIENKDKNFKVLERLKPESVVLIEDQLLRDLKKQKIKN